MTMTTHAPKSVEFTPDDYPTLSSAFRHEDGSITYVCYDDDTRSSNPRDLEGNVVTIVQVNIDYDGIDDPDSRLEEAEGRFSTRLMRRYLTMFRPDILAYCDAWSTHAHADRHGWAYVTRDAWNAAMMPADFSVRQSLESWLADDGYFAAAAMESEIKLYCSWASGEVFYAVNVAPEGENEECHGLFGYAGDIEMAEAVCGSPITEEAR